MMLVPPRWKVLALTMALATVAWGQSATRPANGPATKQSIKQGAANLEQMRRWFVGLDDLDPSVREKSRAALLGLKRADLENLKAVVEEFKPLGPGMEPLVKEIVAHVYLSEATYESERRGFLGILMPPMFEGDGARMEVVVEGRMPGFCGYRALRDGDAIIDVEELRLPQPIEREVFCDRVRLMRPGDRIHLKVLRAGKVVRVPVTLDARPADSTPRNAMVYEGSVQELVGKRAEEAEGYWKREFAPVLHGGGKDL